MRRKSINYFCKSTIRFRRKAKATSITLVLGGGGGGGERKNEICMERQARTRDEIYFIIKLTGLYHYDCLGLLLSFFLLFFIVALISSKIRTQTRTRMHTHSRTDAHGREDNRSLITHF